MNSEKARMHLAQAATRAISPSARQHIHAALQHLDADGELVECPACGRLGTAPMIDAHDC